MAGHLLVYGGFFCPLLPLVFITALNDAALWPLALCRGWWLNLGNVSALLKIMPPSAEQPKQCLLILLSRIKLPLPKKKKSLYVKDSATQQVEILGLILRTPWTCSTSYYHYFSTFAEFQPHNRCCPRQMVLSLWAWDLEKPASLANVRNEGNALS